MLSWVVPDRDGMTAIECGPRWREPSAISSAGIATNAGNCDWAASSCAAGCMRMPAPPEPRKNRFCAPSARHLSSGPASSAARSTAPAWMRRNLASSKFSIPCPPVLTSLAPAAAHAVAFGW